MPSIESSFMLSRKHDDSCGLGVPALKRVGEAWMKSMLFCCIGGY